jgi:hypothetical protein
LGSTVNYLYTPLYIMAMIKKGNAESAHDIHEVSRRLQINRSVADNKVWANDLESEFALLRTAIEQYPYVSMVSGIMHPSFIGC